MILFSANNSLCGEGNNTSRSDDLMYFRELVFRKPRLSNSSANLSSPSPLEIERNQRKTSDFPSDIFQAVTEKICAGTVSKNSLTNENLAFAFDRALRN